jgi:Fis family transcriptional regulator, factor for inversion stimulation protein
MKITAMKSVREILDELEPAQRPAAKERANMKDQLQQLVRQMYQSGILYSEAVREFKKRFILDVLRENRGNQCKAARELGMHRNTLSRTIAELGMKEEIRQLGMGHSDRGERRLQKKYEPVQVQKLLVPRKRPSGQQPTAISTQHSA